jgi:flagellar hook-associated protein 2
MSVGGLSRMRIGGLATGIDTDQVIFDLMKIERMPIDKVLQKQEKLGWKRDKYREITSSLRSFKDNYLNSVKHTENMLSASNYKSFDVSTIDSSTGLASTIVDVSGTTESIPGNHTITVNQIATNASVESDVSSSGVSGDFISRNLNGSAAITNLDYTSTNKDFNVVVDGVSYNISLSGSYDDVDDLVNDSTNGIQKLIDDAVGAGKVAVSSSSSILKISAMGSTNTISLTAGTTDALGDLKYTAGDTNEITDFDFNGKDLKLTLDGVTKTITFDSTNASFANINDLINDSSYGLQKLVDDAFGSGKITVSQSGSDDVLQFTTGGGTSKLSLSTGTTDDALDQMKFNSGEMNRINVSDSIENLKSKFNEAITFNSSNQLEFTINGAEFTFDSDTTLSTMMNSINSNSTAQVTMTYDETSDQFRIIADQAGEGNNLNISDTAGNFFSTVSKLDFSTIKGSDPVTNLSYASSNKNFQITIDGTTSSDITLDADYANVDALAAAMETKINADGNLSGAGKTVSVTALNNVIKIKVTSGTEMTISSGSSADALDDLKFTSGSTTSGYGQNGVDANVVIDGQSLTRSSNTFNVNGVSYTLKSASENEQNINLTQDIDTVFDKIVKFIDSYNSLIDDISTQLSEEYDRDYQPLTDEQKDSMSEGEIEKWETEAKKGLLRNDGILENIVSDFRNAIVDSIDGVGISFYSIGISSTGYSSKGKLTINETKLKEALENDSDSIMSLFSKTSTSYERYDRSLDNAERTTRYNEQGIVQRINDIIQDNTTTLRDENGRKGILLEQAGLIGDTSEFTNSIYKQMDDYKSQLGDLYDSLDRKEDAYYKQFTALETYIQRMNSQGDWLSAQLGAMG